MTPTDIPDIPAYEITSIPAPEASTETQMLRAVGATTTAATRPGDLTKVEVLSRAHRRLTAQIAGNGITEATLSLMRLYERLYDLAPGVPGKFVQQAGMTVAVEA